MSDDLVQSAEDANYAHKIEFVIKTEDHRDIISRFNRQSALTMSTEDFQLIFTQCDKGSSFHTCMQNKFGRHGLRILYTEGLMPSSVPGFSTLAGILVIGYYHRASLVISSHPSALMAKVLPENRWTVSLESPLCDDEFIDGGVDKRWAMQCLPVKKE